MTDMETSHRASDHSTAIKGTSTLPIGEKTLRLVDLWKSFSEGGQIRSILAGVNVAFNEGEFVAIQGKSGSGKTTLLNLISGIDLADRGAVYLDGQDLSRLDDYRRTLFRRENIGFVFQFFNLIPTLSVWENVTLPLELNNRLDGFGKSRAAELLAAVGLDGRLKAYPDRLSGGEQQRVAIARALIHDPWLVLADEPTGNLDDESSRQVLTLLDRLTRHSGKLLILVTHSVEAASFADRTFYLRGGKLVEKPS